MQEDAVEVTFCDLCGTSVPVVDLSTGTAVRHLGKTVGACCLPALRPAGAPAAVAGGARAAVAVPMRPAGAEPRLLPVAVILLAAIAAATIFLDLRLNSADATWQKEHGKLVEAQASDSQVLAALAVAMDAVPRRADLDTLAGKLNDAATAAGEAREQAQKQLAALRAEVAALAQEQRQQVAQGIDYRPLIEDLRQRQQRLVDMVAALRSAPPADPGPATPAAPAQPAEASGAPALPDALAAQVKKLTASDAAVRFEAVDELLKSKDVAVVGHLLPLARDADAFVRRLTVEGLAQWKRPEVVDTLLAALADADEYVRETAWRSLKEITGQKIAFDSGATKDARARAIQRWQEWWDKNKATFGS